MAKKKKYWDIEHEEAIETYITTDDLDEKHVVYKDIIQPVFKELTYNIFFTYNFNTIFPDFHYMEHEVMTHLYEKLEKVNTEKFLSYDKKNKAFSYFGTIAKRYLILQTNKVKKNVRLDELDHELHIVDNSIEHFHDGEKEIYDKELINYLGQTLNDYIEETETIVVENSEKVLTTDDEQVAFVIQHLLKNYQKFDIYNKKQLYVYIREATNMPTRKITESLKKIKSIYSNVKIDLDYF